MKVSFLAVPRPATLISLLVSLSCPPATLGRIPAPGDTHQPQKRQANADARGSRALRPGVPAVGSASIRARPIDSPAPSPRSHPNQALHGRSARMVIKDGSAGVEATRVRRVAKTQPFDVEVVAELVTEGA